MSDSAKDTIRQWATPTILVAIAGFLGMRYLDFESMMGDFKSEVVGSISAIRSDVRHVREDIREIKQRNQQFMTRAEVLALINLRLLESKPK